MAEARTATPRAERLLSVIELQNAIAAAGLHADEVTSLVADRAALLTSAAGGVVALVEGDELVYRAATGSARALLGSRVSRSASAAGRSVSERQPVQEDAPAEHAAAIRSVLCVPLLYGENAVGVLEVVSAAPSAFTDEDVETLRLLAQIVAISLHRAYTYPRPRYDNQHDALTGLANRRAFDERIDAELARNRRYGHSFSLALVRLDGLEDASDRLGQAAADAALREVALVIQKHTRAIDACFRIGAEELAIVMPGTSLAGARILAERCRDHVRREARPCEGAIFTRFGVVEAAVEAAEELAMRAHAALHEDRGSVQ